MFGHHDTHGGKFEREAESEEAVRAPQHRCKQDEA